MYDEINRNKRRTVVLLGSLTLLLVLVSGLPLSLTHIGRGGWIVALAGAAVVVAIAYLVSGRLALSLAGARPVSRTDYPRLYNLVEGLCIAGGVPVPRLYLVEDDAPNAFATGRNPRSAAVAVTSGLLARLNRAELEGVLAHELSHIRNYDTLVATVAVVLAGAVDLVTRNPALGRSNRRHHRPNRNDDGFGAGGLILSLLGLVLALLAPFLAQMLRFAVSRNRETLADVCAADLTRYPPGLISALAKLRDTPVTGRTRIGSGAIAHLWFSSPTGSDDRRPAPATGGWSDRWAQRRARIHATHPPIDERIAALQRL